MKQKFNNPTNEYRGKPFWSWNGKLDKDELIRQIHVMQEMGLGGFFMHSRTGLITEYLGDEWFDLINACTEEAKKLGMEAWLYDEDRWPSGSAGGKVTKYPENRQKYLRMSTFAASEFSFPDEYIAAFTCKLNGLNYTDCSRVTPDTPKEQYQDTLLLFTVEEMSQDSFYNGQTYLDTLNADATQAFIESTHELYRQKSGDYFGTTIKGMFTDEPHRGIVMCREGVPNPDSGNIAPWTAALPVEFQSRFGYDIVDNLPEVFLRKNGEIISQVTWHYMELIHQMFLDNFMKPYQEWCRSNNLILTGHVLHEDSLVAQTIPNGSMLRSYEYMDYPGVDVLTEVNKNYWVVKQISSAARQFGKKWLLSELYGCSGWQMSFQSHKAVGLWQALMGINLRCHHLSWYTMEGEAKRDYPASILHQSTWYKEYRYVEDYFSRLHVFMEEGEPVCDLLVLDPVESVWSMIHSNWAYWLGTDTPEIEEVDREYSEMFKWLCGSQIDFDYGNEDHIARFASVEHHGGKAVFKLGKASYKMVMVSGLETIRSSTLEALKTFKDAGGVVVFAGDAPAYVNALNDVAAKQLADECLSVAFERDVVISTLAGLSDTFIRIADAKTGLLFHDVYSQVRRDGNDIKIFIASMDRDSAKEDVEITIASAGFVEKWDPLTGDVCRLKTETTDGSTVIKTSLPASGELLLKLTDNLDMQIEEEPEFEPADKKVIEGPFEYELDELNVYLLDKAKYRLDGGGWSEELDILKIDRRLRETFKLTYRGGTMVQPWYNANKDHPTLGELELEFNINVETLPQNDLILGIEHPEYFDVILNNTKINNAPNGWWCDPCIQKLSIPVDMLTTGTNTLVLKTKFRENMGLEAIYLMGDFGVDVIGSNIKMTALPQTLNYGDISNQGLPFYTGRVCFKTTMPDMKADKLTLDLESFGGACATVSSKPFANDCCIGFQPYTADIAGIVNPGATLCINIVLTRKNVFGPLHEVGNPAWHGPDNFITEGSKFTTNYRIIPQGLLGQMVISSAIAKNL